MLSVVISVLVVLISGGLLSYVRSVLRGTVAGPVQKVDLAGQTFVVTGASRGIGFSAGLVLLDWGGTVVFAVRDVAKCQRAILAATSDPDQRQRAEVVHLDLSSFASVRKFAADTFIKPARRCHCLINNAHCSGLVAQLATVDGVEHSYQVNYLSHFLLTLLLMPALATTFGEGGVGASPQQCGPSFSRPGSTGTQVAGRVVHVTSRTYALAGPVRRDAYSPSARHLGSEFYRPDKVYADTKLMQVLFSKELTAQATALDISVSSNCVHPGGLVRTAVEDAPPAVAVAVGDAPPAQPTVAAAAATAASAAAGSLCGADSGVVNRFSRTVSSILSDVFPWWVMRGPDYCLMHRFEPLLMLLAGTNVEDAARAVVSLAVAVPKPFDQVELSRSTVGGGGHMGGHAPAMGFMGGMGGVGGGRTMCVEGGKYFNTTSEEAVAQCGTNDADSEWLWLASCELVGLPPDVLLRQQTAGMSISGGRVQREALFA